MATKKTKSPNTRRADANVAEALQLIEQAQRLLERASQRMCPIRGAVRQWNQLGAITIKVDEFWHTLNHWHETSSGLTLDSEPEDGAMFACNHLVESAELRETAVATPAGWICAECADRLEMRPVKPVVGAGVLLIALLASCGPAPRSEWAGTWRGAQLTVREKCAEPRVDEREVASSDVRLSLLELGPDELAAEAAVGSTPALTADAAATPLRVRLSQGPGVNTSAGVKWTLLGGNLGDREGDRALVNQLVLTFDDVGLGESACRYGTWTIEGEVTRG